MPTRTLPFYRRFFRLNDETNPYNDAELGERTSPQSENPIEIDTIPKTAIVTFCEASKMRAYLTDAMSEQYLPTVLPKELNAQVLDVRTPDRRALAFLFYRVLYLCLVSKNEKNFISQEQADTFKTATKLNEETSSWLGPQRGFVAFMLPPFMQIANFIALYQAAPLITQLAVSTVSGITSSIFSNLAGWRITGTNPHEASNHANTAQNLYALLEKDYEEIAKFLLDNFCNGNEFERLFAISAVISLDMNSLLQQAASLNLSFVSAKEILRPLQEVVAYITEGTQLKHIELTSILEISTLNKQTENLRGQVKGLKSALATLTEDVRHIRENREIRHRRTVSR